MDTRRCRHRFDTHITRTRRLGTRINGLCTRCGFAFTAPIPEHLLTITPRRSIMSEIIPPAVELAAKRGFIRTTAQAYAATLTTGISATVVLSVATGELELLPTVVTLGVALLSPLLAGAASYLSITAKGIPEDYVPAAVEQAGE